MTKQIESGILFTDTRDTLAYRDDRCKFTHEKDFPYWKNLYEDSLIENELAENWRNFVKLREKRLYSGSSASDKSLEKIPALEGMV